ncbi:hypothetical protein F9N64_19765 [Salmonella enterica]|nr:hypothetical protein [Salmonella enterica subsp. salamae]EGU9002800.1 hypothetical protein [Salmonella enterica]
MDNEVTFSLSYEALFSEAERLIRDIRAFSHLSIMQDDITRSELRAIIRFWNQAAVRTGCPEMTVGRDHFRLQQIAGLPEGDESLCR